MAHSPHDAHARFRFSVIGSLLSSPPGSGGLRRAIEQLSEQSWRHPITGAPTRYGFSTIQRWYYTARDAQDPVEALRRGVRKDYGRRSSVSSDFSDRAKRQYDRYPSWTLRLHYDNILVDFEADAEDVELPSYSTFVRFMRDLGLRRQRPRARFRSQGEERAHRRLEEREVRSYEVEHVGALWHVDFHRARYITVLSRSGERLKPELVAFIDDRSRLCLHAQFYLSETTEDLVHAFSQALLKRGLPRSVLSDNGAAMIADEFCEGLARLSILHDRTLAYSPHQNGKQEHFWSVVEGRLLAMLEGIDDLSLGRLNEILQAWVEQEYNQRVHSETKTTPLERFRTGPDVSRAAPSVDRLRDAFRRQVRRKPRLSDGTFSLEGLRFEIPSAYRHLQKLSVRYARWDLGFVHLVDERTGQCLARVFALDRSRNAEGKRRRLDPPARQATPGASDGSLPPLLEKLVQEYAATGIAPSYLPKEENDFEKGTSSCSERSSSDSTA